MNKIVAVAAFAAIAAAAVVGVMQLTESEARGVTITQGDGGTQGGQDADDSTAQTGQDAGEPDSAP